MGGEGGGVNLSCLLKLKGNVNLRLNECSLVVLSCAYLRQALSFFFFSVSHNV